MSSLPPLTSSLGPWPNLANTGSLLDRVSERRRDQAFIATTLSHADARAVLIGGETIVLAQTEGGDPFIPLGTAKQIADIDETIFIGVIDGAARIGHAIAPEAAERLKERTDLLVTDLRLEVRRLHVRVVQLAVPRADLILTLLLPTGSEPGSYEVEIRDSNATVRASARGDAELRNYVSTLEVAVSLGDLSPGAYSLAVRRDGNDWQQFPIRLE